jgi:hypothetical protein
MMRRVLLACPASLVTLLWSASAFADACARSSRASNGAMGGPVSTFVEVATPALCLGLVTWAARRNRR